MSSTLAPPVKQIAAGVLDIGHVDVGPPDGPAVVLLHGWPYDSVGSCACMCRVEALPR